jgi:hypothetical protein
LLLDRVDVPILDAVEHLVGLQAQAVLPPYYGLAARLRGFDPVALGEHLEDRSLVRITLMRGTVHMATPRDVAWIRPLVQHVIERGFHGAFGRQPVDVAAVRALLRERALTARELARAFDGDPEALSVAVRTYAPLVQIPPRAVWGRSGQARYQTFEDWTGLPLRAAPLEDLVLRYLRAFGPASVMDAQNWSGLTKLAPVFARLELVEVERGLFDVPDGPRPDADTYAPPRLIGEYDNALLGHKDRTRIVPEGAFTAHGHHVGSVLVDGFLAATWRLEDGVVVVYGDVPRDEVGPEAMTVPGARDVDYRPAP